MNAAQKPAERRMTVAEFLAFERTPTRDELVDGVMVAMNSPYTNHAELVQNIGQALEQRVSPPRRVYWSADEIYADPWEGQE